MNTIRPCGCKGIRTCLKCEEDFDIEKPQLQQELQTLDAWSYCSTCDLFYAGWNSQDVSEEHPNHENDKLAIKLPGIMVQENFLSKSEAGTLLQRLDALPWTVSQSGRRKQNYGPRTNFKKRKLQLGNFCGFPADTEFVQQRLHTVPLLSDFQTIEQCSLEYDHLNGACIDPHIDDCWVWGERVVTVNCLGDAVLTLTYYNYDEIRHKSKYNFDLVAKYENRLLLPLERNCEVYKKRVFRINMPNCSLIVLYGPARYQFEHCVLREDILSRRVCIAYREFTPMYLDGEDADLGGDVIKKANNFWTHYKPPVI